MNRRREAGASQPPMRIDPMPFLCTVPNPPCWHPAHPKSASLTTMPSAVPGACLSRTFSGFKSLRLRNWNNSRNQWGTHSRALLVTPSDEYHLSALPALPQSPAPRPRRTSSNHAHAHTQAHTRMTASCQTLAFSQSSITRPPAPALSTNTWEPAHP